MTSIRAEQRVIAKDGLHRGRHGEVVDTHCFCRTDHEGQTLIEVIYDGFQNTTLERLAVLGREP